MYDLHTHSNYSDGSYTPEELIVRSHNSELSLVALTDHDTVGGIPHAVEQAKQFNQPFICGVELEAEYSTELHILGLGIDIKNPRLTALMDEQAQSKEIRNTELIELLKRRGMDISETFRPSLGCTTRANIAVAMVEAGYVRNTGEAFGRFIGKDAPLYVPQKHPPIERVMEAIASAGGYAVIAHPMKMNCDHAALVHRLAGLGLWGIEAYYPRATEGQIRLFKSLARQYSLHITCGSDCHGTNRPGVELGCSWRDDPMLQDTLEELLPMASV